MREARSRKESLLGSLPSVWPESLRASNRSAALSAGETLVVLDDDPTGSQTVYDIPVLTEWSVESLRREFENSTTAFYILIVSLSLELIRSQGPKGVAERLSEISPGCVVIVNAVAPEDLDVVVAALRRPEVYESRFLFRTGAEFVSAYLGLASRPMLSSEYFPGDGVRGGLIVVGSYVPLSSQQLSHLLAHTSIYPVEVSVDRVVGDKDAAAYLQELSEAIGARLERGLDVVLYTERRLKTGVDDAENLAIGRQVSNALVTIVQRLSAPLRYLVAKGGITSSAIATDALGVRRAMILGTIIPGAPVWSLGPESAVPGLNYVVFPGNVGGVDSLTQVFEILNHRKAKYE